MWDGRVGAIISARTAAGVFIINLAFLVVEMATAGQESDIGTLYKGDCTTAKALILNLLGVMLLGASNYTTQCF